MNLENKILQLCFNVLEKEMTPLQAQKEILRLLDVVWQSKQLVCDCEPHTFYEWEKDENKCSQCGKPIYEQTDL